MRDLTFMLMADATLSCVNKHCRLGVHNISGAPDYSILREVDLTKTILMTAAWSRAKRHVDAAAVIVAVNIRADCVTRHLHQVLFTGLIAHELSYIISFSHTGENFCPSLAGGWTHSGWKADKIAIAADQSTSPALALPLTWQQRNTVWCRSCI